jgi:transcriptional regulator with XRE-family HTH domain
MSESRDRLKEEFQDPEYRHVYAEDFLNTSIATQIRVLREQRGFTQEDLAKQIGTKQAGISRLENVNHSAWKTDTLHKIARAFDVRLRVTFETFGSLLDEAEKFGRKELERQSFHDDPAFHEREAASTTVQTAQTVPKNPVVDSSPYIETNTNKNFSLNTNPLVGSDSITIALSRISITIMGRDQRQTGINQDTCKVNVRAVSFGNTVSPSNPTSEVNRNRNSRGAGIYVAGPIGTAA